MIHSACSVVIIDRQESVDCRQLLDRRSARHHCCLLIVGERRGEVAGRSVRVGPAEEEAAVGGGQRYRLAVVVYGCCTVLTTRHVAARTTCVRLDQVRETTESLC